MSETIEALKKIEDNVTYLLRHYRETRDSDMELFIKYWRKYDGLSLLDNCFEIDDWFKGKATHPESISRCRRQLQKDNEDLRGEEYYKRHHEAAKTRKEIPTITMNQQPRLF